MNVCVCVLYPFKLQAYASCGSEYHSFILRCVNHPSWDVREGQHRSHVSLMECLFLLAISYQFENTSKVSSVPLYSLFLLWSVMGAGDASVVPAVGTSWSRRKGAVCSLTCALSPLSGLGLSTCPLGFLQWGSHCKNASFLRQAWVQRISLSSCRAALWWLSCCGWSAEIFWAFFWPAVEVSGDVDPVSLLPHFSQSWDRVIALLTLERCCGQKNPLLAFVEHFEVSRAYKFLLIFTDTCFIYATLLCLSAWLIPVIGHS